MYQKWSNDYLYSSFGVYVYDISITFLWLFSIYEKAALKLYTIYYTEIFHWTLCLLASNIYLPYIIIYIQGIMFWLINRNFAGFEIIMIIYIYIYIYIYTYIYIYICISAEKYKTNIFHINYLNNRDLQYLLLK